MALDRITMFKIPEEHIDAVLAEYTDLTTKATKVGLLCSP
jgi:hypothetical protein